MSRGIIPDIPHGKQQKMQIGEIHHPGEFFQIVKNPAVGNNQFDFSPTDDLR